MRSLRSSVEVSNACTHHFGAPEYCTLRLRRSTKRSVSTKALPPLPIKPAKQRTHVGHDGECQSPRLQLGVRPALGIRVASQLHRNLEIKFQLVDGVRHRQTDELTVLEPSAQTNPKRAHRSECHSSWRPRSLVSGRPRTCRELHGRPALAMVGGDALHVIDGTAPVEVA